MIRFQSERGVVHEARSEDVYPDIPDGSVSLVICDGPYNMRKADWDKFKTWDDFRDFYRPHFEAWGRICAESATLYVWGTDDSLYHLRGMVEGMGWERASRVTWDKVNPASVLGWRRVSAWIDSTESCDVYRRGGAHFEMRSCTTNVWTLPTSRLHREQIKGGVSPHRASGRPMSVALHVSQKPIAFYDRMIRASSRPGDTVLEPFGGTCRAAVAVESMDEARRYIVIEANADGRDYLGPSIERIEAAIEAREASGLFVAPPAFTQVDLL